MSGDDLYPPMPSSAPSTLAELHERTSLPSTAVIDLVASLDGDICVVGAGGKMGFHLTHMLQRAVDASGGKKRVVGVSRFHTADSVELFQTNGLTICPVDLLADELPESIRAARTVFFLAGVKFGTKEQPELLQEFNVKLPERTIRLFPKACFVALSTGCVYPFVAPRTGGSRETDPTAPSGRYAESCLGREQVFRQSTSPACLIRLNYSVDLRYGVLVDIALKVWRNEPVDVTTGYFNAIWQGDALNSIILAVSLCRQPPDVLNVTGTEILSVREVALRFGQLFGRTVNIIGNEAPTAWLNDAGRSHQLFGPPSVSADRLMEWVADWIRNERPLLSKPTHFEVRSGQF